MSEHNHLNNGRFLHSLDNWTASGAVYSAGDGDEHYGVAVLSTGGDYVEQTFSVPAMRRYTLHLSVKPAGSALTTGQATVRITDGNGNVIVTSNLTGGADAWHEQTYLVGLAHGTTYTLRLSNASAAGDVSLDDVWLWFVPLTRQAIAQAAERKLGRVGTELNYESAGLGSQAEGEYTDAIDEGLRSLGAINPETGLPDVRYLDEQNAKAIIDSTVQAMLEKAAIDFGVEVDITLGPHSERLSQKREALEKLAGLAGGSGGGAGNRQIIARPLHHPRKDYTWDD